MLMTFPTKESLLRNLNERDVSEVFLIIANFKSLAGWNLIPLRNLTILLGPNSAGKSSIYDAIKIIRCFSDTNKFEDGEPLWSGYRSRDRKDPPYLGFSMPYILNDRVHTRTLDTTFMSVTVPSTGLWKEFDDLDDYSMSFGSQFILEGMLPGEYLFEDLKNVRYTIIGWEDGYIKYEVYLNGLLASYLCRNVSDVGFNCVDINIYPIANKVFYAPSVVYQKSMYEKHPNSRGRFAFVMERVNLAGLEDLESKVRYFLPDFQDGPLDKLPMWIYEAGEEDTYKSEEIAFAMVVSLYVVCYHRIHELLEGTATQDIRLLDSDWHAYSPSDRGNFPGEIYKHEKENPLRVLERLFSSKATMVPVVNRWLKEPAFLNTQYQVNIETSTEILDEAFDKNFNIRKDYIRAIKLNGATYKEVVRDVLVAYRGRMLLVDNEQRELSFDDVGAGFSQVIPILIGLASRINLLFKQPEVHLHPRLQSRVADCFVETVFNEKQNKESRVRIIETHSEHFVLRLLRRLRESSFDELYHSSLTVYPEDVAFVYFQPQGDSTRVHEIAVLPSGEFIDGWPDGFFDERDEDLWGMPSPRGR